jgi:FkbM family methyltransferase
VVTERGRPDTLTGMRHTLKYLIPLTIRNHLRLLYFGWVRWPKPLWRLRGRGGFDIAGHSFQFVDVARKPHDWWAWQARDGTYERGVLDFLAANLRAGDVFFDIGVYIGVYSLLGAAQVGASGRVISFEPDPLSQVVAHRNLMLNGLLPRVRLVAAAVSDHDGPILLDAVDLGESTSREGSGSFEARCVRMDAWCRESGIWPDVIKMDIEGGEVRALGEHARQAVEHARAIVLEVHEDQLTEQGHDVQRMLDWLVSTGKLVVALESRWTGNFNVAAVVNR